MNVETLTSTGTLPGLSRRSFLQFCATVAVTLGLPAGSEHAIAQAIITKRRPSVIWLQFSECTGCTESILRSDHPAIDKLILELISLDYHETLFAGAGHQAEDARKASMAANKGKYLLVVEGAIPAGDNGIYCKIGGQTAVELLNECAQDAAAVIAIGSCASWGGMPSTKPNPTGCVGVDEIWKKSVVNIPGCPPNPYNFLSTVVSYITFGKLPELDGQGRPKFAYSRYIHENCERRCTSTLAASPSNSATPGIAPDGASTNLAARGPRREPTAPPFCSAMSAEAAGLSAPATRASVAPRKESASRSLSSRLQN